jgi:hypothetical protein
MKRISLAEMTVDQLVDRFAEICMAQDEALNHDAFGKYNRLYKQLDLIDKELRSRGRDARLALMRLCDSPNMQVRLIAATRSLGVAPEAARRVIQAIWDSRWPPQAMRAGMTIKNLDNGVFVPD